MQDIIYQTAHAPSANPDTIAPGITAAVHVLGVLNSQAQGPVLVPPSAVVITQPAVIPVVMYAQDNHNVQVQHIVRAESNMTVRPGIHIIQPQVKRPHRLVRCWCLRHITWLKMPVLRPPVEQEHGIHHMNVHTVHPVVVIAVQVDMMMVRPPVQNLDVK